MKDEHRDDDSQGEGKPESHVLLWSLVIAFIVIAIGAMAAADLMFSPEAQDAAVAAEAVGK